MPQTLPKPRPPSRQPAGNWRGVWTSWKNHRAQSGWEVLERKEKRIYAIHPPLEKNNAPPPPRKIMVPQEARRGSVKGNKWECYKLTLLLWWWELNQWNNSRGWTQGKHHIPVKIDTGFTTCYRNYAVGGRSIKKKTIYLIFKVFELLVWPHEVEPWFHSWHRGRVETLDAKYI